MNFGNVGLNLRGNHSNRGGCAGFILGPIFVLVGFGVYYFLGGSFKEAYASRSWPTVQGQVTHSEMTQHHDSDGVMYGTDIAYDYTVDDQQYTSYRVALLDGTTSVRKSVQDTLKRYPAGGTVTIYYDPEDPSSAVLEPGFTGGVLLLGSFIICFPAVGVLAVLGSLVRLLRFGL